MKIMALREREEVTNSWLEKRLDSLLPSLMEREELDMWIVVTREDNQDPVAPTLIPPALTGDELIVMPPTGNRVILVFHRTPNGQIQRFIIATLGVGNLYESVWDRQKEDQWECLARIVNQCIPTSIGINISETFPHADGLSHTEYNQLQQALSQWKDSLTSAEGLAVGWLEQRIDEELAAYPELISIAHGIIKQAYSTEVISPGKTTVQDVAWWMRQRIRDLGLTAWFRPMVAFIRKGQNMSLTGTIEYGDILFCDIGLRYLGLTTDTQQLAYVLAPSETEAPKVLTDAMKTCNRMQDIMTQEFIQGRTGNQILASSLARAKDEGIQVYISIHPVGVYGHGPGMPVGVWDKQDGVPVRGGYILRDNTCYALELCISSSVPQWGDITINLEETIAFTQGQVTYFAPRQTEFHLIG